MAEVLLPRSLPRILRAAVVGVAVMLSAPTGFAGEARPAAEDPVLEARMVRITAELRCLVCQNQTVADSNSGLANDLRQQVREMLQRGDSDEQIIAFMTARYGDFVLYRPPVKATTVLLWAGPAVLMVGGLATLLLVLRRRTRLPPEAFEADTEDAPDADAPNPKP